MFSSQNNQVDNCVVKPIRIIPGLVGIVQTAKFRKIADTREGKEESKMSTQGYIRKVIEDVGKDDDFTRAPWLSVLDYVNEDGGILTGCFGDVKKFLKNGITTAKRISTVRRIKMKIAYQDYLQDNPVTTEEKVQKKNDVKARKSLDSIFNRLQKIVSQLAILGENISQEDLNLKFLRSLPSEWNTHVVVWRNKPDLDTMSFDDLYNNFKIIEQKVKGTASSISSLISTANTQVSPASTQVSTASTQVSTANLSDDTVYAFLASQPNGSQLVYEDLEQIYEDDIEEMDLK
ncbi:hypothetical protein Tco_0891652 [Tanacetum coccineum]|uniref:Uncharacterized protein n=1 Tax=Tanacetum coccineum TaxID=301880 RepID=A0ABQ5C3J2_9ASTR